MSIDRSEFRSGKRFSGILTHFFENTRRLLINGTVVALILAMMLVLIQDLRRDSVVMEAITLPKVLINRGFTPVGTSHWLNHHVLAISDLAATTKSQNSFQDQDSEIEIDVPGAGISLRSISKALRAVLGIKQTRVAGEIICTDDICSDANMEMRLRVYDKEGIKIIPVGTFGDVLAANLNDDDLDLYFETAALKLFEYLDPYIAAAYLFQTKKSGGRERAVNMVKANHPDRAWAANLIGLMDMRNEEFESSDYWLERAIEFSENDDIAGFARPIATFGYSLHRRHLWDEALEKYDIAIKVDPTYPNVYFLKGLTLFRMKKFLQAKNEFQTSSEIDPASVRSFHMWARSAAALGSKKEAEKMFQKTAAMKQVDMQLYPQWYNFREGLGENGDDIMKSWEINLGIVAKDLLPEECMPLLVLMARFAKFNQKCDWPYYQGELLEHKEFCESEMLNEKSAP